MKILKKETVPKKYVHKVKSIICDNHKCKKEIPIGENYYELQIDRDDGVQDYLETNHFCHECVKSLVSDFVDELCEYQDLTVTCHQRTDCDTEEVDEVYEKYRFCSYEKGIDFED